MALSWALNRAVHEPEAEAARILEEVGKRQIPEFTGSLTVIKDGSVERKLSPLDPLRHQEALLILDLIIRQWAEEIKPLTLKTVEELRVSAGVAASGAVRLIGPYTNLSDLNQTSLKMSASTP